MPVRIAITMGDYNGIGPEVILKGLQVIDYNSITPIILGSVEVFDHYVSLLKLPFEYRLIEKAGNIAEKEICLMNVIGDKNPDINPGQLSERAGASAMEAVEEGIEICLSGEADALVTAPISKAAVQDAGYAIPGHTEFLAQRTDTADYLMMMVNENLRIGLLTTHIPLQEVAPNISEQPVVLSVQLMNRSLRQDFGITDPRIAVLGLNPHAGDDGHIGNEEREFILPALGSVRNLGVNAEGPFPADGFFGNRAYVNYDGILAMYHDQGLIPFKTLSFGSGVNFTAGLPFVRTSPDHGTAFDIAGTGKANPASFLQALELAIQLISKRDREPV